MAYTSIVITGDIATEETLAAIVTAVRDDQAEAHGIAPDFDEGDIRDLIIGVAAAGKSLDFAGERLEDRTYPAIEEACIASGLSFDLTRSIDEHDDNFLGERTVWTPSMTASVSFPWFAPGNPIVDANDLHRMLSESGADAGLAYLERVSNPRSGFPKSLSVEPTLDLSPKTLSI